MAMGETHPPRLDRNSNGMIHRLGRFNIGLPVGLSSQVAPDSAYAVCQDTALPSVKRRFPQMVRARRDGLSVCCLPRAWGVRLKLGFGNWNRGANGISLGSVDQVDREREDDDHHHVQSDVEQVSLK